MKLTFSKLQKLLSRRDFREVYERGKRYFGAHVVIYYQSGLPYQTRLGITISKKWGKAHERNRFKRIVREGFRTIFPSLSQGLALNVHPRQGYENCTADDIANELKRLSQSVTKTQSKSTQSGYNY